MESWNTNLKLALQRGEKPVVKAELRGMSTAFLEVRDYTAGAGDSFSIVRNGSTVLTLTEGTHFDAETSNTQTAINIVNAILLVGGFKVLRFGSKLKIRGGGAGTLSMAVTSTDEDAWRQYRVGLPNRVVFCSDARACNGKYGAELKSMGSSASSFDLEERKTTLASFDIVVSGEPGSIGRGLVTSLPLVGQVVELYMGTVDLSESDYELFGTATIVNYTPGDSEISIALADPQVTAADAEVSAHFVAMHPLDVLKWAWERTFLGSDFWDVASFDSTTDDEISHWLVSAHSYHFWSAPDGKAPPRGFENVKLSAIINEAQKVLPGMVRRNAEGVNEYLPFDPEASTVRHLERKDWESISYESLGENQYTSVAAVAPESELFGGGQRVLFRVTDTQAQALTEADEADDGKPSTLKVESRFFGTPAFLHSGVSAAATTLQIAQAAISGVSGFRSEDDGFSVAEIEANGTPPEWQSLRFSGTLPVATIRSGDEADSGASPSRTVHLLITDGGNSEIVEATATSYPAGGNSYWYRPAAFNPAADPGDPDEYELAYAIFNSPIGAVYFPQYAEATVTRAALGSTSQAWTNGAPGPEFIPNVSLTPQVYDLTIAKRICEMQLERFRYGCPIARMIVKLEHGDIQEGDFISFDDPRFLWQEHDGATQTVIWEVIGKRVQPIGDSPRVELTVAWVRSEAIPYATLADPTWEIPIVSPVLPVPSVPMLEPYFDDTGASYAEDGGGLYYPI